MNRLLVLFAIGFLTVLSACDKSTVKPEVLTLQIADQYKDCMGVGPRKCMQVKINDSTDWQLFYDPIRGFTYEEGYEYRLVVKREHVANPPADGSSNRYTLIELVDKIKK
ncbi:hypothetical protein GCM10027341_13440 [Spirosoma knui]